jgi:hypothetical protein
MFVPVAARTSDLAYIILSPSSWVVSSCLISWFRFLSVYSAVTCNCPESSEVIKGVWSSANKSVVKDYYLTFVSSSHCSTTWSKKNILQVMMGIPVYDFLSFCLLLWFFSAISYNINFGVHTLNCFYYVLYKYNNKNNIIIVWTILSQ